MRNKLLLFILTAIVVVALIAIGVYFVMQNKPVSPINNIEAGGQESPKKLVTDDFEVTLSDEWVVAQASMGTSAMAAKINENIKDPAAQKINFTSYLAVSRDAFSGNDLADYMQAVKDALLQTAPDSIFSNENGLEINGRFAHAMEVEMAQQGVNFKVLIVAVRGDGDDVWVMSFNTLKDNWQEYVQDFSDMANSFFVKLK